jgi:hypothetical protein
MSWRPKAPPAKPTILVSVGEPEGELSVFSVTHEVPLTHEARIHKSSCLLVTKPESPMTKFARYSTDYTLGPEIKKWLKGKPHSLSIKGEWHHIRLTKEDAALFKVFFI